MWRSQGLSACHFEGTQLFDLHEQRLYPIFGYNWRMPTKRIHSIDQFRGFAILTMVLANYMGGIKIIPSWLKHAPDIGLTFIDVIAPFFIFAIALTYHLSFRSRLARDGSAKTYSQFFIRYLAIIGLGAIISAGETALGENPSGIDWGALQAIGVAGLITLIFINLKPIYRWIVGSGILMIYQFILDKYLLTLTLQSPHGGLFGSVSWGAMLILGTALADLFHDEAKGRRVFPWISLSILVTGILLSLLSAVSKNRVSASYVLITLGISAILFYIFHLISTHYQFNSRFLMVWGRNPLILYFLHYVLIGIFFLPGIPLLYSSASIWTVLIEVAVLIGGISFAAYWMERRKIVISL
jgi:predicted acyltransferase